MKLRLAAPAASVLIALGLSSPRGEAVLIAYDQFTDYADGPLIGTGEGFGWGANTWTGSFPAALSPTVSSTGGLTVPAVTSAGGGGLTVSGGSETNDGFISRSLATPITASGTYYFSFVMQMSGSPHNAAGFIDEGSAVSDGSAERLYAGAWNNESEWRIIAKDGTSFPSVTTGISETTVPTHFVLRLNMNSSGNDTAQLFVNPADAAALSGAPDSAWTYLNDFEQISSVGVLLTNIDVSGAQGDIAFDEIRLGTEASDMFGAVPEPSALLQLLGGLLLLQRRRRA